MASSDIDVRILVKYYTVAELETAQLAIIQADMSLAQDSVQITSQSSRAGSASGIAIPPSERAKWKAKIEEAINELNGATDTNRHWATQNFNQRTFGT